MIFYYILANKFQSMKLIKVCLFALFTLWSLSCKKSDGISVSTNIELNVVNAQGQDLLNSAYTKNDISIRHIINGQLVIPLQEITIHKESLHVLTIFDSGSSEPNITLIQFGSSKPDTIRREILKGEGFVFCSKVWFNNELKFDDSNQTNLIKRRFTIVK